MIALNDYTIEKECIYKDEHYSVRDNGAIMRHPIEGKRVRPNDYKWTFGKKSEKTGYMVFAGKGVHRIVAFAFLGTPESEKLVVDHIDTNRCNNRPENLCWVTRLENVLNNPITKARIESICGSVEAFLANPSLLRGHEAEDTNFKWMRAVSSEEAKASLERMQTWAKNPSKPKGSGIGEWIYSAPNKAYNPVYKKTPFEGQKEVKKDLDYTKSLTPNAIQLNWNTPSVFPCCPQTISETPISDYMSNLNKGEVFCTNDIYTSLILDFAYTKEGDEIIVMTKSKEDSVKNWALAKVSFKDGMFVHENRGSFFGEDGALKYFTLAQGKEWTGGDVFDDYL